MLRVLAMLCALASCAGDTHDVSLALSGTCEADEWAAVDIVSVELWGVDGDGEPCAIARRCLYDVDVASAGDVATALAAVNQPLVDATDPDAHTLAVIGHATSCFDPGDRLMCGYADLADVDGDGTLAVDLTCGSCSTLEVRFCP